MAHRRVKEIDYDEDDYDDYYSGEEEYGYEAAEPAIVAADNEDDLSAEDKEQLRRGTESVREALGDAFADVTDAAIQEALWHYYYDVAKSVTYLKSMSSPKHAMAASSHPLDQSAPQQAQPKKQKQASKFDQAATSAAQKPVQVKGTFMFFLSYPCLFLALLEECHHTLPNIPSWTTLPENDTRTVPSPTPLPFSARP